MPALKFVTPYLNKTRIQKTFLNSQEILFLCLNHHKYFDSYMNRDKPNRNQFKLKCFKPNVFILKPILEKCALKCVF